MTPHKTAGAGCLEDKLPGADPRVFEFLEAWREARTDNAIPYRDQFDPLRIPNILGSVWLYRYEAALGDFVCRLAGEEIHAAWGERIKGRRLREVVGAEDHDIVLARWLAITNGGLIQYGMARERLSRQSVRRAERVLAPMRSDDGAIDIVLGLSLYRIGPVDPERPPLIPEDIIRIPCAEI